MFRFLQYLVPAWYYHLKASKDIPYFVDWDKMPETEKALVLLDKGFSSHEVAKLDAAYQAWHKGVIHLDTEKRLAVESIRPTLRDNYYFVRKYFHPVWSLYILLIRLLSFRNPFAEVRAFLQSSGRKRVRLYDAVFPHEEAYASFESKLIASRPKVTVVIPTLNRYDYLEDGLKDLEVQDYTNFDVIVVDQSKPFRKEFYDAFRLDLKVIHQEEPMLWLARNTAVKQSDADFLLLYDDDSRVDPDWISQHLKCLDYFQADISSGVSLSKVGDRIPANYAFFRWADQLDTGNVMIRRGVFEQIGLFDRQFEKQRMGDGEYGLRAYLAGLINISNCKAQRIHLKGETGGLRQTGSWDAFRTTKLFAPRPIPSVLYLHRKYFGKQLALLAVVKGILPSLVPYRFKKNKRLLFLGSFLTIFLLPIVAIQVTKSWNLASKKLAQGAMIEKFP